MNLFPDGKGDVTKMRVYNKDTTCLIGLGIPILSAEAGEFS